MLIAHRPSEASRQGAARGTRGGSSPSPFGFPAACQALVAPREVSGRAGQALSLNCWYAPGYQGYNKYWCRGASRDSCRKVVETAGREAPRQRGRVSIADNHVFCLVLLTLEELSEEDAGSYWCGVERVGRDIMTPVTIRVLPGERWHFVGFLVFVGESLLGEGAGLCRGGMVQLGSACTQYKPVAGRWG